MRKSLLFTVSPSIPPELSFLETLSYNLWWCWHFDAIELFRRIDPPLWKETGHNPLTFFSRLPQRRLETLVNDAAFRRHYDDVRERFEAEIGPGARTAPADGIAYFSLEYGIHESLSMYSGGLGCLAADHLKSASDMNLPLVAVGLLYRCGYFQQRLNDDGWQQETSVEHEIQYLPVKPALNAREEPVQVTVPLPDGPLRAAVWRVDVGRVPLYLLDSNLADNPVEYRHLATNLYDANRQIRLRQELLLGIGGFRALLALGYDPPVCHMNEGHAAFVGLARMSHLMKNRDLKPEVAREIVHRTSAFTTHTPVPAGNETFAVDLLGSHLAALQPELGLDPATVTSWGQPPGKGHPPELTMTILALRSARFANGVSRLHGRVTRRMWAHLWPGRPHDEIPIRHVTNGVHAPSWLSPDNSALFDRYLGPEWRGHPSYDDTLQRIDQIPDDDLWRARQLGRSRLIRAAREFGERQLSARNAPPAEIAQMKSVLHHDALTIGFARRFAAYKRPNLILKNAERLLALLAQREQPVQIIFAGKAHPADDAGKNAIRELVYFARRPEVRQRILFIENYDIQIARYLVQGVDVWLNTPRRPQEASGTSGMKAALNGALHLSVLDGWWEEAYAPDCGWAIGRGEEYDNHEYQDALEAQALYNLLENEVVPRFYNRSNGDLPRDWVKMMKSAMRMALGYFTSHRMVSEYHERLYEPARREYGSLTADQARRALELVAQLARLQAQWHRVRVHAPQTNRDIAGLHVGDRFEVGVDVELGDLRPDEVDVEIYFGPANAANEITESHATKMRMTGGGEGGKYAFREGVVCETTGRYGLTARVTPRGTDWESAIPGFIAWADGT